MLRLLNEKVQSVMGDPVSEISSCSPEAEKRGPHQKIIAFTFFDGPTFDKNSRNYIDGIESNLKAINELYGSNWIMRLYYDLSIKSDNFDKICEIACNNFQLELCDVNSNLKKLALIDETGTGCLNIIFYN